MRGFVIWIAVASLALVATSASAADVEEQMLQMQQKLQQLEERLDATGDELAAANDRVEQQEELIQSSGIAEARGASSGLADFVETLEVGGWVAASYLYNFNGPDGDSLGGANSGGMGYPFHPDANSFELDQLWFELEKPVTEDSRAGFRADILYGKTAEFLSGGIGGAFQFQSGASGGPNEMELYQGYAQYLAPIGNGVTFKAGKFATTVGAEVVQAPYNLNITRGNVYTLFQPITHVGLIASMENSGATAALGVTNDTTGSIDVDNNNNKSILWHLGYAEDTWGASFNGVWGADLGGNERDKDLILDAIVSFDPTEQFSGYVNATWRQQDNRYTGGGTPSFGACGNGPNCKDGDGWGVALAGRYAITDRTGLALRGEYVDDHDGIFTAFGGATPGDKIEIISVTGTLDHMLTEQLMLRGEVRWDEMDGANDVYVGDDSNNAPASFEDDQIVGAVEIIYNF